MLPWMWKHSAVFHNPKKGCTKVLNDLRLVAVTSLVMKALERIVKSHITKIVDPLMGPLQS